jgi:hypothetical protein
MPTPKEAEARGFIFYLDGSQDKALAKTGTQQLPDGKTVVRIDISSYQSQSLDGVGPLDPDPAALPPGTSVRDVNRKTANMLLNKLLNNLQNLRKPSLLTGKSALTTGFVSWINPGEVEKLTEDHPLFENRN